MANKKTRAQRRAEYLRQKATTEKQAQAVPQVESSTNAEAKEAVQQIRLIPLASIVTEEYQRVLNMKNVAGIVRDFDPAKLVCWW